MFGIHVRHIEKRKFKSTHDKPWSQENHRLKWPKMGYIALNVHVCYRNEWVFIPFILQWLDEDPYIVNHMAQFVQTWLKQSSPWTHLIAVSAVPCSCTLYEKVSSRVSNQHICENKVRPSACSTYIPLVLPPHVVVVRLFGRQPLQNGEILVGDSQQFSLTFCFVETISN